MKYNHSEILMHFYLKEKREKEISRREKDVMQYEFQRAIRGKTISIKNETNRPNSKTAKRYMFMLGM